MVMRSELTVSVIDSSEGLKSLRDEWDRLLGDFRSASICLSWEWLHTWWEIYRDSGVALHVVRVQDGDRLVGLAPFFLQDQTYLGFVRVRTLRFLGTGEPEWEEVASEYLDIMAVSGREEAVVHAVWAHLRDLDSWDQLVFNDVLDDSLIMKILYPLMVDDCLLVSSEEAGIRYAVDLPPTWDAYLGKLETGAAKRLPYKRRKFERSGHVSEKTVETAQDLEQAFDELVRLHTARWTARGSEGLFASARFTAYHKQLALSLLPRDMLRMRLLSLDGVNVAVLYNFRYRGTEYFYQGGFDATRAAKYSPGLLAHVYAIADSIQCRLERYDFMKGGTVSYKREYGCVEQQMHDLRVFARTLRGKLLALELLGRKVLRLVKGKLVGPVIFGTKRDSQGTSPSGSRSEESAGNL